MNIYTNIKVLEKNEDELILLRFNIFFHKNSNQPSEGEVAISHLAKEKKSFDTSFSLTLLVSSGCRIGNQVPLPSHRHPCF